MTLQLDFFISLGLKLWASWLSWAEAEAMGMFANELSLGFEPTRNGQGYFPFPSICWPHIESRFKCSSIEIPDLQGHTSEQL